MNNRGNSVIVRTLTPSLTFCCAMLAIGLGTGCIELGIITPIGTPPAGGDTLIPDPDNPAPGDGEAHRPVVALSVSNPAPQLSEEVTLTCRLTSGDDAGALFDFAATQQPAAGLNIDRSAGRATFIVAESDLNIAFSFTCSVTTDAGESAASSALLVTPTAQ